jgi:hypothetical protein
MNFSASTTINVTYSAQVSATAVTAFANNGAGVGFGFADTGSSGTNIQSVSFIAGRIETGASDTRLWYGFKSEVWNSAARIVWGSWCEYTVIN